MKLNSTLSYIRGFYIRVDVGMFYSRTTVLRLPSVRLPPSPLDGNADCSFHSTLKFIEMLRAQARALR